MVDSIALSVPRHLHKIVFSGYGIWGVRAFCQGCGWQEATKEPTLSDEVYWRARRHLDSLPTPQEDK